MNLLPPGGFQVFFFSAPLKVNLSNFDLVMESDLGTFAPVALQFAGSAAAQKVALKTYLLPVFIQTLNV